ncbi:hypothetical protein DCAR_0519705 [Daucus carota subsp. sativus]|uniref:BZIP domain-containing protein n=1 Tax=Daucus carota subsp. sativus TaxID=79200 RepID=A0AAF0X5V5_DAUCS|nr:hypothetical protein DCAR_0519705 [Daucus carota subsp. sativus]
MSDGEEGTLMRHSKPASSVQEVPKVTAPGPDRLSSVQAFHGKAAAYYATIVASSTRHPNMWRSQDIPYAIPLQYPALFPPGGILAHLTMPLESAAGKDGNPDQRVRVACMKPTYLFVLLSDKFELRREKRKQTNWESARRSRLRKQYEYEEVQHRVHALNNENHFLREELQKVSEECNKVTSKNDSIKVWHDLFLLQALLKVAGVVAVVHLIRETSLKLRMVVA